MNQIGHFKVRGGGICPRGYMSKGVCVRGISVQGVSDQGVHVLGVSVRVVHVRGVGDGGCPLAIKVIYCKDFRVART